MQYIQKIIKLFLPLAFGVGILWFIVKNVDIDLLVETVRNGISWSWVVISLLFALLANICRGIRWRQQLRTVDVDPSLHVMSVSFFGNYGMNLVFPRLGEVWRCNFISNHSDKPFSTVAGTILSERMCDILCTLVYVLICLLVQREVLVSFFIGDEANVETSYSKWAWLGGLLLLCLLIWWILNKYCRHWKPYQYILEVLSNVWVGFKSLKELPNIWSYIGWSAVIWILYYLNTLTQFYFFGFTSHLGFNACLAVFVMGTIAQILPIQGGLGVWQYLVSWTLINFCGIGESNAGIFAIVAWTIEQCFVLLMGFYAIIAVAVIKNQKK